MAAVVSVVHGLFAYALFVTAFLYSIGFVGNVAVPKSIDSGLAGPVAPALIVDALLLGLFAVQHSVMARRGFKRWWTQIIPQALERSTFVLLASLVLFLTYWQWRPVPAAVWTVTDPALETALHVVFWGGWGTALIGTFLIDHFELFGVRQAFAWAFDRRLPAPEFRAPFFYRYVRHPIYLGFLLAFWSTPRMTEGHLLFAVATTGYILVGIWFEERDLIRQFGERYRRYRDEVGMLVPKARRGAAQQGERPQGSSAS